MIIGCLRRLRRKRLKRDGKAVGLEVEEVALGVAGLAAGGDVGTAGLLDGDGDCEERIVSPKPFDWKERMIAVRTYGWGCSSS